MSEYYAIYLFMNGLKPKIRDVFITWHQYSCIKVEDVISLALKVDSNGLQDSFSPFDPNSFFYNKDLEFDSNTPLNELMKDNELFRIGMIQETCDNIVHETIVDEVIVNDVLEEKGYDNKVALKVFDEMPNTFENKVDESKTLGDEIQELAVQESFNDKGLRKNGKEKKNNQVHVKLCKDAHETDTLNQEMRVEIVTGHQEIMIIESVPLVLCTSDKDREKPEMNSTKELVHLDEVDFCDYRAKLILESTIKGTESGRTIHLLDNTSNKSGEKNIDFKPRGNHHGVNKWLYSSSYLEGSVHVLVFYIENERCESEQRNELKMMDATDLNVKFNVADQKIIKVELGLVFFPKVTSKDLFKIKGKLYMWHKWKSKLDSNTKFFPFLYEEREVKMGNGVAFNILILFQRTSTKRTLSIFNWLVWLNVIDLIKSMLLIMDDVINSEFWLMLNWCICIWSWDILRVICVKQWLMICKKVNIDGDFKIYLDVWSRFLFTNSRGYNYCQGMKHMMSMMNVEVVANQESPKLKRKESMGFAFWCLKFKS